MTTPPLYTRSKKHFQMATISPFLHTTPLPGRGLGTLATAPMPRGTRLIADPPVLAATAREMLNEDVLRARVVAAYAALDDAQRDRVRGLAADPAALARWRRVFEGEEAVARGWGAEGAGHVGGLGVEEKAHVMGAWNTNCFGVGPGESREGWVAVVAPSAARLNHSCRPNAVFAWNDAVGAITVQAIREIGMGEEVTIAYVDVVRKGEKRRRALSEGYGFDCGCEACVGGEEEGEQMRGRIGELRAWLEKRAERSMVEEDEKVEARELVEEGVKLHERAGLMGVHLADL